MLEDCLPAELRGPTTTLTPVAAGLSGAGVYRVEANGQAYVLKVTTGGDDGWPRRVAIQRRAADAGLAPAVVHVDPDRRAVVTAFVVDRSFPAWYANPQTRADAVTALGRTLRRVHDLSPPEAPAADPRTLLAELGSRQDRVPGFVREKVRRALDEEPPPAGPLVLSHNDVNPTNLAYDGERILLLDWDAAGPNEPLYDLAASSVFLRMDDPTAIDLLSAHEGARVTVLPARFDYDRRLIAALCGSMFLQLARDRGHPGSTAETLDDAAGLDVVYQRMRAGALNPATADGQWAFGLALVKASAPLGG